MQVGGPFYLLGNGGFSQNNGDDLVGALDYGRDTRAARECSRGGAHRGGACIRACRTGHQLSQVAAQNAANELIFGCVASCLDRMVR
jgi:hypothetical protein